jgi:Na+:H+ antiporter, NhaA family
MPNLIERQDVVYKAKINLTLTGNMNATKLFREFFESEKASAIVLLICAVASLLIANLFENSGYVDFWNRQFAGHSIADWINDGLMAVFFLLIGLELEREIYAGELSNLRDSLLPIFAAMGGMLVPAGIYLVFNAGTATSQGAGIPMATDIAFAIGVLSLLGKRVPVSLKVFLTALAVMDDLGAILVIAVFYTDDLHLASLMISLAIFALLMVFNKLKIRNLIPYIAGGIAMWYFMLHSGVHATIAGVLLAFAIPFGSKDDEKSPSALTEHYINFPVSYFVLPVFALANTAIIIGTGIWEAFTAEYSLGIAAGLVIGKSAGIFLASLLAVKSGLCRLPDDLNWKIIGATGFLGGIGFTMSIFITLLAFNDKEIINNAKLVILISSTIAGITGYIFLKRQFRNTSP